MLARMFKAPHSWSPEVIVVAATFLQIPAGGPALLTGPITLCGRSDLDPKRFFSGSISNLMLFDTSLEPEQVGCGLDNHTIVVI
jgi:hypothetical protein